MEEINPTVDNNVEENNSGDDEDKENNDLDIDECN